MELLCHKRGRRSTIENYKKVVKRSGYVNDCSEVHAEYQDAKNNRSEETAKASKVLSTDDIKPEGLVHSDTSTATKGHLPVIGICI